MARIEFAPEIQGDFDRIIDHLLQHAIADASARISEIVTAIHVLQESPHIGRAVADDLRELVIGKKARGYVALYRYVEALDAVFVLAVRSQREAGYDNY
jgi:toxin ParE1/3/4